jgi:hypothetical protein
MGKEIEVDLWKTGVHKVEIGIKKQAEYKSKSRQYTSDTDIIGEYKSDFDGYVTVRTTPWEADKPEQRLVIKTFTQSMNWKGTLEEMVALGQTRTLAAGEGMPVFTLNLSNLDRLVQVERIFKPKSLNKAMFSLMFIDDDQYLPYHIEANRLTLGSDWTVKNHHDEKVADIDGSKFNIGGKWKIKMEDDVEVHPALDETLVLFCAFLRYEESVRKRLEENAKKMEGSKEFEIKISDEELYLYDNPRRMKY